MIKHNLTLERLAQELHRLVHGRTLVEVWTQEHAVMYARFAARTSEDVDLVLQFSVTTATGTILPRTDVHRQHRNSLDIFTQAVGQTCGAVMKVDGDRIITFMFDDVCLHALLFSGGSGNVVLERDGSIIDALHSKKTVVGTPFTVNAKPATLGAHLNNEQQHHTVPVDTLVRASTDAYVLERNGEILFSLIPLHGWNIVASSENMFAMIRQALSMRRREGQEHTLRTHVQKQLEKEIKRHRKALQAMRSDAAEADHASHHRHIGDLLLSYPHPQQRDLDHVELSDWDGTTITVTIDPGKTIVENAHALYNKARRSEESAKVRRARIPATEKRLQQAEQLLEQLPSITDLKHLESLMKDHAPSGSSDAVQSPYRVFPLDEDYILYVGKNAANNDQLTMKFAKQNDWWFHARGNSGSHCVLRGGDPKKKPHKRILEAAGAIAAYYSGDRNASWTPVVYTQRKYVRKPKGANVGAVVLEREEVIMVKPGLPE